ncbi:Prolyl endopeptidase [uncultured Woeseiaceae bacterium]|uniref:prolyl oligopeptidase n=1 Tax=uncultured Woeseiaceae bacterium TaxID=1983305 RepID=A0A7D9D2X0_9GAMM|nr:Prolyl endopeptidase [uncultured Woeseiaceae bacterium]
MAMHRKTTIAFSLLTSFALIVACSRNDAGDGSATIKYPETATVDHVDNYHGNDIADPYRWLEDDVRESDAVKSWVDAQNEVTFAYLATIPERNLIAKRMRELWDYERFSLPRKADNRYFYSHNDGLQNQNVLYTQSSLDGDAELLIDPNTWSDDGTVALSGYYPSKDGSHIAYTIQDGGSDWREAKVMNVETGAVLDDHLEWLKFTGLSWTADGSAFYYSRYPATAAEEKYQSLNKNMKVYLHRIGTSQDADVVVYERPDNPDWGPRGEVTDDGEHLVITISVGTDDRYSIVHQDLTDPEAEPVTIIEGFDYDYSLIGNIGSELYFRTNNGAPKNRLITIDVNQPDPQNWREVIPEAEDVLDDVNLVGGRIIAEYMQDAWSVVKIFELDGSEAGVVDLPGIGSAYGFNGKLDDPETFFGYASFNMPSTIKRLDVSTGEVEVFKKPEVDFDPDDYQVEQVFYTSKDGTRVPMFISHRKDVVPDGNRPTMLYGYGGFNISIQPSYSTTRLAWMEMGGIYAVANLRGGGEYGEEWHQAGTKLNKQNVFDDFIAAGEYLIENNYTNSDKLAIFGGSNGGLLVGAVTNQRPELFGAAIPAVGVMDMLRFHRFTAGRFWTDDYGSADNPDEFVALRAYSPYHNIRDGTEYPAILVTTADTDDRVVPGHSFKYSAAIQRAQGGDAPVLIRIETRAGHGAGVPTDKVIEDYADRWAFLVRNLDMRLPEGYGE